MINPSRWAMEYVHPLESYGSGRVALLGDSVSNMSVPLRYAPSDRIVLLKAHAMAPHLGNGAGQAFEVSTHARATRTRLKVFPRTPTFSHTSSQ